jgi:hypothetical protein
MIVGLIPNYRMLISVLLLLVVVVVVMLSS